MDLTYEIINNGKGYMIKKNGVGWMVQNSYNPYPGATIEESAQNHINAILAGQAQENNGKSEMNLLKERISDLELMLTDIILGGM